LSEDFYAVLELNKSCSQEDVEKAYKKLALKYHPDRNPGDTSCVEKFMKIQSAYEILRDPQKRKQYDNPATPMMNPFFNHGDMFDTEDLDIRLLCPVTISEAVKGTIKTLNVHRKSPCNLCRGNGHSDFTMCPMCQGRGVSINAMQGFFRFQTLCGNCMGQGKIGTARCVSCHANKYGKSEEVLFNLNIPKGVQNGMTLALNGQGHHGISGRHGNIYVECKITDDSNYKIVGLDIECKIHAKYSTLLFGGKISIPTPEDENIEVEIPQQTKCGTKFRVKEKGMPDIRNNMVRGDLIANVMADVPSIATDEALKNTLINYGL